jgi:hypothetical protein
MLVDVDPGSTTTTGILQAASSNRRADERNSSAALLPESGARNGTAIRPVGALTLTIRPAPARTNGSTG